MRVILAGQKSFGLAAYEMLLGEGHDIATVWSPTGYDERGNLDLLTKRVEDTGDWAHPLGRDPKNVGVLDADLFVAAHSHDFISRQALAETRLGGIGYHPSLLPRHRGRDAIRWTIHMGDPVTGGTVYWLTDNVDGGPVAAQDWCLVPPAWRTGTHAIDGAKALWSQELFPMGIRLLRQTLRDLEEGIVVEVPQDELNATWEPSWERPPLHRPDLVQIGAGIPGMTHITRRD